MVVDRPVDSEVTPPCAVLMPVDVELDSARTLLLVVDRPVDRDTIPFVVDVDSDPILLWVVLNPEKSSDPFTASVLVAVICPAATFVTVRSEPTAPTLTVLAGAAPANPPYVTPATVALVVFTAVAVALPVPNATSLPFVATAPAPIATDDAPVAVAPVPWAIELAPAAFALVPIATPLVALAVAFSPSCSHGAPPTINPLGANSLINPAAPWVPTLPRSM